MSDPPQEPEEETALDPADDQPDQDQQEALEELANLQQELDKINDEASDKVLLIEQEFNQLRRPVYERRSAVIKDLPGFWKNVLLNHPIASGYINETDEEILEHIVQIEVEDYADIKSGFSITFTFDAARNPYFSNPVLVKHFKYSDDGLTTTGDVPKWHKGMEPAADNDVPAVGEKRPASGLDIRFFSWFVEEEVHELGNHDELAEVIKEEIWPNPHKFAVPEEAPDAFGDPDEDEEVEFDHETAALENGSDIVSGEDEENDEVGEDFPQDDD